MSSSSDDVSYTYDLLGRKTQTIEDYTNGTPTSSSNRTTNFTYDGLGHTLTLQAVMPSGMCPVTVMPSLCASAQTAFTLSGVSEL